MRRRYSVRSARFAPLLFGLLLTGRSAAPQELPGRSVQGYGFFAPGVRPSDGTGTWSVGAGADWLVGSKLAIGLDGHFFGWWECSSCGAFILTGNAGFLQRRQVRTDRWEPFAFVGVGAAATEGGGIGVAAFSGGTNYWVRERLALRFEGRYEYVFEEEGYVHLRLGVVF
jgi:hypothetical protein